MATNLRKLRNIQNPKNIRNLQHYVRNQCNVISWNKSKKSKHIKRN